MFILQLIQDTEKQKSLESICGSILAEINASFALNRNENGVDSPEMIQIAIKYFEVLVRLPDLSKRFSELSTNLFPTAPASFDRQFYTLLMELHQQFFIKSKYSDIDTNIAMDEFILNKYTIWLKVFLNLSTLIQNSSTMLTDTFNSGELNEVYYQYLYWPLSLTLAKNEVCYLFITKTKTCLRFQFNFLSFFYCYIIQQKLV